MLVEREGKILLIERNKGTPGFALPAGHVDDDAGYESAAKRELKEEVGLDAQKLELIAEGRKENPCRREGGVWHYWKIYKVETTGKVSRSKDETKQVGWYSRAEIKNLPAPGLEPVMHDWFQELGII